jgi:hypothetical protein
MTNKLPEDRRKAIFLDLVNAQDAGASVGDSRQLVAARHDVRDKDVRAIEQEGIDEQWPPLK